MKKQVFKIVSTLEHCKEIKTEHTSVVFLVMWTMQTSKASKIAIIMEP